MANRDEETYGAGEVLVGCFAMVMVLAWIVLLWHGLAYFVGAALEAQSRFHWG